MMRKSLVILALPFLLTHCGVKTNQNDAFSLPESRPVVKTASAIRAFNLNGKMAVKEGSEGFSAAMSWRQRSHRYYTIDLSGPFGAGHVNLTVTPAGAILKDNKNQVGESNAVSLLKRETGYSIPVNYLHYWLKGLAIPGLPATSKKSQKGLINQLSQAGWSIQYRRYMQTQGITLPQKIFLNKGALSVKIFITRWRF